MSKIRLVQMILSVFGITLLPCLFSCQPKRIILKDPLLQNISIKKDNTQKDQTQTESHHASPSFQSKYPNHLYITAFVQEAESIKKAEEEAKVMIAQNINSELTSITKSIEKQFVLNQSAHISNETSIQVTVKSDFKHAHMIQIDPQSKHCEMIDQKNQCSAFAYLERKALADQLFIPLSPIQTKLEKQIQQLIQNQSNHSSFSNHYAIFQELFNQWLPLAAEIYMIDPNYIKNYAEMIKNRENIENMKADILNQYQIHLLPIKINQPKVARAILKATKQLLTKLGLKYKDATLCQKGYAIQIEGHLEEEERSGMMRKKRLYFDQLKASLIQCPNQSLQAIDLPELFVYESYNKSIEEHLVDRIENRLFNEMDKNNQIEVFIEKFKQLLKEIIPL
jgi:hypothetical protein